MVVRLLSEVEIAKALQLVWQVFYTDVAPGYTQEGIGEFQRFLDFQSILGQYQKKELLIWGAFEGDQLLGVGALRNPGHVSMLYVQKAYQRRGVGKSLFFQIQQYAVQANRQQEITVNAAPGAVAAYQHMGFVATAQECQSRGIRFVPMVWRQTSQAYGYAQTMPYGSQGGQVPSGMQPGGVPVYPKKKMKTGAKVAIIAASCVAALAIIISMVLIARAFMNSTDGTGGSQWGGGYNDSDNGGQRGSGQDNGLFNGSPDEDMDGQDDQADAGGTGVEAIPEYKADDVTYELEDKTYSDIDQKDKYYIEFSIRYPQITGLDSAQIEQINTVLKDTAMKTENDIYENPTDAMKEKILGLDEVYLVNYVDYKATYQSNDFISVTYDDQYWPGDLDAGSVALLTANVNLKEGTAYQVSDIVNLDNDQFMEKWLDGMKEESDDAAILSQMDIQQFRKILRGKDEEYIPAFFVDKDGLEIGFSYVDEDSGSGWITAPFTPEEIKDYQTDSTFWNVVKWE